MTLRQAQGHPGQSRRMTRECGRTAEVLAAMTALPEPDLSNEELRRHADGCELCREMVTVVTALRSERDRLRRAAAAPSAGLVWWRAPLRARQQAALRATVPVTVVHVASLVAVIVLAIVLVSVAARSGAAASLSAFLPSVPSWAEASQSLTIESPALRYGLALGATAWLILGPVALYFALRRD